MRSDDIAPRRVGVTSRATEAGASRGATPPGASARRSRSRRAVLLGWLRRTHLYVGLWGAVLGLLFGATGILLNHRAVLKIPVAKTVQRTVHLPVPAPAFETPQQMSAWLQAELGFLPQQVTKLEAHPATTVVWGEREVRQPERWLIGMHSPQRGVAVEFFVGNRFVKVDRQDATPIGTLTRLHMSTGANAFWVLLSDTIAGSFILLSITGLLLWTQLHTVRTAAAMTSVGALVAGMWFMWTA